MHPSTSIPPGAEPSPSYSHHVKATLVLGLPLVGSQLAQMGIGVTDTVMIGWLGARELASSVLGTQLFFNVYIFGAGLAFAILPIISQAMGAGNETAVRRAVRMGLWAVMAYGFIALAIMWQSKAIYQFLGQEPANIDLAQDYLRVAMWGIFPTLLSITLRSFLSALELARIVLVASLAGLAINALFNYMLIFGNFGAPRLEIVGAAWASLGTNTLITAIMVAYILLKKQTRAYNIFNRLWKPDWVALKEVVTIGLPIGIGILAEVGLFYAASIMMGWLGTIQLAAHGVALQIAAIAFMVPLGFASAATIRVGNALGRKDNVAVGRAGFSAAGIALSIAAVTAILLVIFPDTFVRLFLDMKNPDALAVLTGAVPLILVAAAFQFVDSLQAVMLGVLRGIKDIAVPTQMGIISYWVIGVPSAWALAFPLGLGGVGLWIGLAIGLASAAILLTWRFRARARLGLLKP